jgi:hypothetical protein
MDDEPEFIQNEMKSSEEYAARLRVDNEPGSGDGQGKKLPG